MAAETQATKPPVQIKFLPPIAARASTGPFRLRRPMAYSATIRGMLHRNSISTQLTRNAPDPCSPPF